MPEKYSMDQLLEMLGGDAYYSMDQICYVYHIVNNEPDEAEHYKRILDKGFSSLEQKLNKLRIQEVEKVAEAAEVAEKKEQDVMFEFSEKEIKKLKKRNIKII